MATHSSRLRTPSEPPSGAATFRTGMTALGLGEATSVAMLGEEGAQLRRYGSRWRLRGLRDWRLRTKLTAVLLVPLVLAGVLGALRVGELVREARGLAALASQIGFAKHIGLAVHDLQAERHLAVVMLVTGRTADGAALQAQCQRVDAAVTMLRTVDLADTPQSVEGQSVEGQSVAGGQLAAAHRAALDRLSGLAPLRQAAVGIDATTPNVIIAYSDLIAVILELDRRVLDGVSEPFARQAAGLQALAVAKEQVSQQHVVLLAGILSGALSVEAQVMLRTAEARFNAAAEEFGHTVPAQQRDLYVNTGAVADRKRLLDAALERATRKVPLETVADDWNSAAVATIETIRQGETTLLNELQADIVARSDRAWSKALWEGAAVAALLALAVLTLVVVVRSLLHPLRTLRTAAFDVADRRLPEAVGQLQSTDGTASQTTVDPVPVHSREEVGQVARAFDTVHAQAVRLAAEQAVARNSLNDIFRNLSGRNQGLLDRQQQLLDDLRSTAHDPELSGSLSQLDHLAARMRRHGENLLLLAGGRPGAGIDQRVAVLDVLRSAISAIEEYQRVAVRRAPAAMVAGSVTNDLVHLVAELLDNATRVAPPETTVELAGGLTNDGGLLLEIIDHGPGLPSDDLQEINGRLACPPAVDSSVSRQMGLFVVRTLAAQHGITVRLRQRPGGGITATVLLPSSLVTIDPRAPVDTAWKASQAPAATEWGGPGGQLPVQVSVVDEASAADLFSPASIGMVTSQYGRPRTAEHPRTAEDPRTAEEEWQELFGYQASQPEPTPVPDQPVARQPPEVREEIFEAVSAWFRERESTLGSSYQLGDTTEMPVVSDGFPGPAGTAATLLSNNAQRSNNRGRSNNAHEWRSPLDEAWQAAQALRTPVDHGVTPAGLPKRRPRSYLVPGADGGGRHNSTPAPAGPALTPDQVRGRLSRYQRGLRVGRHALIGPDEQHTLDQQHTLTDTPQRRFEEDQQ